MFRGAHKLEVGLAGGPSLLDGIKVNLQLLELDAGVGEFAVEVTVAMNLLGESPIVVVNEGIMKEREIDGGAHQEKAEPRL